MLDLFKRKPDPLSDRARELDAELRKLEKEIEQLSARVSQDDSPPRIRSTVRPHGQAPLPSHDPVFEEIDFKSAGAKPSETDTAAHYNELGVRKFDLAAVLRRLAAHFRRPEDDQPKLINYLASGSIHGLRPLRYEKRVARNRFIFTALFLLLALYGLLHVFLKR